MTPWFHVNGMPVLAKSKAKAVEGFKNGTLIKIHDRNRGRKMIIEGFGGIVKVDGKYLSPSVSQSVLNHSPDGFAWGYAGSGPSQLALAILLEAGVSKEIATRYHHDFKRQFLVPLQPNAHFKMNVDVDQWLKEQR